MTYEQLQTILTNISDTMELVADLEGDAREIDDAYSSLDSAFGSLSRVVDCEFPDEAEVRVVSFDTPNDDYSQEHWRGPLGSLLQEADMPQVFKDLPADEVRNHLLRLRDPDTFQVRFNDMQVSKT